ncbi:Calcium-independent phospholipase A2-gamma [Colletotrichum aenigma]|uniref:Calcium-independent phospholipase A2-gamma n=1 Tax=Colletotrichum aenigma TaxID=1215731 RepID=UPI0018726864|nr:Calcium-independent phospholipase A2-gamma [Colletotrichum aenigma]KAF5528713.1 Calcium-independent phospholipase A2-gamma [Colletotrichum aenigma]
MADDQDSNNDPVYLLSLDGGGVRGISELVILHEIMKRLQKVAGLKELPRPRDYFHLIGGTSTGGLIAILLGRMGMTTEEAIKGYEDFAATVFCKRNRRLLERTFKEKTLEKVIRDIVAARRLKTTVMIDETRDRNSLGHAFVCSVPRSNMFEAYLFRTYRGKSNHAHNVEIWEAARATSSAPGFFNPVHVKVEAVKEYYYDGALAYNNPAKLVLDEADSYLGSDRKLGFLLSLGTGLKITDKAFKVEADAEKAVEHALELTKKPVRSLSGSLLSRDSLPVYKHIKTSLTDPERTHHELDQWFRAIPNAYFRLNLDKGAADIKLNEYKKMKLLREATEKYLKKDEVSASIDKIVSMLHNKEGVEMPLEATCRATSYEAFRHAMVQDVRQRNISSPQFTGRAAILGKLDRHFCEREPGSSSRRLLRIWGMGGVGKTQIALKFRDLHGSRFDHVFWINAATTDSIYESFRKVTAQIYGGNPSRPNITGVLNWLSQNRPEEWLLVFDNNDSDSVNVSKYIPAGNTGNILFTSRRKDIKPTLDHNQTYAVDIMDEKDAVKLLLRSSKLEDQLLHGDNEQLVGQIVKELGYLPLAIDQAGSYIHMQDCTFGDYLFGFQSGRKQLMEDPSMGRGAFNDNPAVYGTFELSYKALEAKSKDNTREGRAALNALRILCIFCFYHNENLTDEIISRAATNEKFDTDVLGDMESVAPLALFNFKGDKSWDSTNYTDGISLLRSYSLIKKAVINDEWHSMHILVHSWARDRMHEDAYKFHHYAARSIIFDSFDQKFRFEDERFTARLLLHLKAMMKHGAPEGGDWFKETRQETKYAKLLQHVGMWREALHVLEKAVQERRDNLEPEHWLVVDGMWALAKLNKACCRFDEAVLLFHECIDLVNDCSSRDWAAKHVHSIGIDFAEVFIQKMELGKAQNMLVYIIEEAEKKGSKHPQFRRALAALAVTMQLAGINDQAEKLEARILELCLKSPAVGPGHRMTMNAISNLATLRSERGEHEKADDMWRHVLEVDERFRGKEHPITLTSKRNVAIGCVKLERLDEAEQMLREVLEASDRVLWRTHLDTLATIECLAGVLYQQKQVDEALDLQEECYNGRLEVLGNQHPLTVKAEADLGKMRDGRLLGVEELAQVQWQGEAFTGVGDSNYVLQDMNDRYLY